MSDDQQADEMCNTIDTLTAQRDALLEACKKLANNCPFCENGLAEISDYPNVSGHDWHHEECGHCLSARNAIAKCEEKA